MEANRRQLVLLGAILVLLASVLYWQSTQTEVTPEEFSAAMRQSAPGAAGALDATPAPPARPRPAAGPAQIPAVGLASLDRAQPEPADSGRDPFRFGSAPAAVAERRVDGARLRGRGAGAAGGARAAAGTGGAAADPAAVHRHRQAGRRPDVRRAA